MSKLYRKSNFGFGFDAGFLSEEDKDRKLSTVTLGLKTLQKNLDVLVAWSIHTTLATNLDSSRPNVEELFKWHAQKIAKLEQNLISGSTPAPSLPHFTYGDSLAVGLSLICGNAVVIGEDLTFEGNTRLVSYPASRLNQLLGEVSLSTRLTSSKVMWLTTLPDTDSLLNCIYSQDIENNNAINLYSMAVEQMLRICQEDLNKDWRSIENYVREKAF